MTAQVPETVRINGIKYALCGVRGEGLFNPDLFEIEPAAPNTSCWRGFICGYAVCNNRLVLDDLQLWSDSTRWNTNRERLERLFGDKIELNSTRNRVDTKGLAHSLPFTGSLLLGDHLIQDLYAHMGFHPAYKYRNSLELTFESGLLLSQCDRSTAMEEIRHTEDLAVIDAEKDLTGWIKDSYRIDY